MTVDALEYLRAQDPVPHGSSAPPMERVLERIERSEDRPGARRGRRVEFSLIPAIAVAATLAVVAAVVVIAVTHRSHAPAHLPPATRTTPAMPAVPSPNSLMPLGGMRGMVLILGAAAASPEHDLISFGQCLPCKGRGIRTRDWLAQTTDGGTTWHVAPTSLYLNAFGFAGADGWAVGIRSDNGHGEAGVVRFFVTHSNGRTWRVVSGGNPMGGVSSVSIAGGEVWSLGSRCASPCTRTSPPVDVVVDGRASGNVLSATAGQPPLGDSTNVSVVALGRDAAVVMSEAYGHNAKVATIVGTRLFRTRDGGRRWQPMTSPCPAHQSGRLFAGGADALWVMCSRGTAASTVRRSDDGGSHWTTLRVRLLDADLQPASAQVAWALTSAGRVMRTADGGETWSQVWYGGRPEPTILGGRTPVLAAESPTTATVIVQVTRGHVNGHAGQTDFVTYRTTDGGRTWRPSVVRLPAG